MSRFVYTVDSSRGKHYYFAHVAKAVPGGTEIDDREEKEEPRVPNVKSAKKRVKTNHLRRQRNRACQARLKTSMKKVLKASDPAAAAENLRETISLLDRYAGKGVIHKNRASRQKSRLMSHVNRLGT